MSSEQTGGLELCRLGATIANRNTDGQHDARDFANLFHLRIVVARSAFLADMGGLVGKLSRTDGVVFIVEPNHRTRYKSGALLQFVLSGRA